MSIPVSFEFGINGIELHHLDEDEVHINFFNDLVGTSCQVQFGKDKDHKYVKFHPHNRPTVKNKLAQNQNIVELAYKNLEVAFTMCEPNSVKTLVIRDQVSGENVQMSLNFQCLAEVENLQIGGECEARQILEKLQKPLKTLYVSGTANSAFLAKWDGLVKVTNLIHAPEMRLTFAECTRLTAAKIHINIGNLTALDILSYIKNWQAGRCGYQLQMFTWVLGDRDFDINYLTQSLPGQRVVYSSQYDIRSQCIRIDNKYKKDRPSELCYYKSEKKITFTTS